MDKITNIVSIGCSWVAHPYDWEEKIRLDKVNPNVKYITEKDAKKYSFAKYLADKLNIPYYNLASAGAPNDSIFMGLFERINELNLKNSFVIIGLTDPQRHQFGKMGFKYTDNKDGFWNWKKTFFKNFYDEPCRINYTIMMLDLFNEYLKNKNSKLVVFNSFTSEVTYPKRNYFFGKFNTWKDYICSYDNRYVYHHNVHPIEYDHKKLADSLHKEYFNE
tara:strand:- start:650 stop:1306 length:657 start_codon:yes stop_codon:yes gene_type:complete